ncbi:TonB-dependent receptor [[Pseudomonas] boreopolis]|uniref:TonB-dependent receptor n=1 Tax=Xanthomonas boreopolis TaxID=86183 RepID=UPI003D3BE379
MNNRKNWRRTALTMALAGCLASVAQAQSTTGSIYGNAPEGAVVVVTSSTGLSRTIPVDAAGKYSISQLPVGTYTVTVKQGDQIIGTREGITLRVGSGTDVSFGGATTLDTVNVIAATVPTIDVTAVDTRTVITAEQLERLPMRRSAEAIALLAPGANPGAAGFSALANTVSFGGAGASENAYYINGFLSSDPLSNLGGFSLPYASIAQQETYTGGYSAKYGRSSGGVINQIGKSGSNELHFGGQVNFVPRKLRAGGADTYFPNIDLPEGYEYTDDSLPGTLRSRGDKYETWNNTYSAYVSGPLIKDRLFAFVSAEAYSSNTVNPPNSPESGAVQRSTRSNVDDPKLYAKLDWQINDNNLLEYTYMAEKYDAEGSYYAYDWDNAAIGEKLEGVVPTPEERNSEFSIIKYTGYLTDNLTLGAQYGHGRFAYRQINPSIVAGVPYVVAANRNPAYGSATAQSSGGYQAKDATDYTDGVRLDLEWVVGDHTITFGVDNMKFEAKNEGTSQVADYWSYGRTTGNISSSLGVGSPVNADNPQGYYARQLRYFNNTNMELKQDAYYVEDRWQVTDNVLLSLGLRNDQFTNKNELGETYMDAKDQWAPRIGAAWDVFGDSTLKVFGNAGRYYLAMPNNVAIRGASASTYTSEYFTYTGIDQYGAPTGLTPVPGVNGAAAPGAVSSNLETGAPVDVASFAPTDLKNMYQDEFILGFEKTLGKWSYGAKLTYRELKSSIDDFCGYDDLMEAAGLEYQGIDWKVGKVIGADANGNRYQVSSCYMFNPGGSNTYSFAQIDAAGVPTGDRLTKRISSADLGFTQGVKREYKAIDLFLERPWDGKWEARIDYTYSKLQGNNEGQVKSEFGQTNISKTQDWDVAELMAFSDGYLANDRRHQIKIRGSYALNDEWLLSGNARILSGMPISCLGFYNPDGSIDEASEAGDPVGYGASYHTCFGKVAKPGSKRTPWTHNYDLGVTYSPVAFDHKLRLSLQVLNLLNERKPLQVDVTSEDDPYTVSNTYLMPLAFQTPRYVMFTASVDF